MAVTVEEFMAQFYEKYHTGHYGATSQSNAQAAAEALLGLLKKMMLRGDRDNMRDALHSLKDQLVRVSSRRSPSSRAAGIDNMFQLIDAIVLAAEKLRQFSPVKESLSAVILEEVRQRLLRIVTGDTFVNATDVRRRALDCIYANMVREAQTYDRAKGQALVPAGSGKLRGFGKKAAAPATANSWASLWLSLSSMSSHKMLPLLQSTLGELYTNTHQPPQPQPATKQERVCAHKQHSSSQSSCDDDVAAGHQDGANHSTSGALTPWTSVEMPSSSLALSTGASSSMARPHPHDSFEDYSIFSWQEGSLAQQPSTEAGSVASFAPPEDWVHFDSSTRGTRAGSQDQCPVPSTSQATNACAADAPNTALSSSPAEHVEDPFDEPWSPAFPDDTTPTVHVRLTGNCSTELPDTQRCTPSCPSLSPADAASVTAALARMAVDKAAAPVSAAPAMIATSVAGAVH